MSRFGGANTKSRIAHQTSNSSNLMELDRQTLIGEIFDLDGLAEDCARDGVYDFLFVAPPLPFARAVGSPVNPLAIK